MGLVWVWVVLAVYELSPHLEIVYWAPPVRFGTNDLTSGRVVPIKNFPHSCKYSTGLDLKVC